MPRRSALCLRVSVARFHQRSRMRNATNLAPLSSQFPSRLAFALRHLEAKKLSNLWRDVQRSNRTFRAGASRHAGADRDEPHPPARLVAASVVREPVAVDVAVAAHLG